MDNLEKKAKIPLNETGYVDFYRRGQPPFFRWKRKWIFCGKVYKYTLRVKTRREKIYENYEYLYKIKLIHKSYQHCG